MPANNAGHIRTPALLDTVPIPVLVQLPQAISPTLYRQYALLNRHYRETSTLPEMIYREKSEPLLRSPCTALPPWCLFRDRWTGYIQPAFAEAYVFIVEANDGARLWIDDQLMFDNFDEVKYGPFGCFSANIPSSLFNSYLRSVQCVCLWQILQVLLVRLLLLPLLPLLLLLPLTVQDLGRNDTGMLSTFTATTDDAMVAGQLYAAIVEFRENYGAAEARLLWRSDSQPLEVPILGLGLCGMG